MEADGLTALAGTLDGAFEQAIAAIIAIRGRVIVTGIGKSGHVARKIAATLASTGTPAFFVHASEASHGDLGMITRQDCVVALSNSGSTAELASIIAYARRFGLPLIAITAQTESTLGRQATVVLRLPDTPEACPHNLAPTTSTTCMLALGDALAVALMAKRGFTPEDFSVFHPGGALGRRLLTVADLMHGRAALPMVAEDDSVADALIAMSAGGFGVTGVRDAGGALVGIITDGDLRRHMASDLPTRRAGEIMTRGPQTITAEALAAEAVHVMNSRGITCLFVADAHGETVGLVHVHDCLRAGVA
ncbi:MAG: KpsF/GutQ family sugar-phosphate isomerase [Azospirillaceae bacterium]